MTAPPSRRTRRPGDDATGEAAGNRLEILRRRLPGVPGLRLRGRFRGRRGLIAFLAVLGPGMIAGIAGNDAGGITTYSILGAETGLRLLWLFPVTIAVLAIVQEMAARLGVVTGQGLSDLIRDRFGVRWQIVPRLLDERMGDPDRARSKRVSDAMLKMIKLDIAELERAYRS